MDSYKFCRWITTENIYICEVCGFETKVANAVRTCGQQPSLATRIGNFIPAVINHVSDGGRKCSQDEINSRLKICKDCPLFVANTCIHNSCGCAISDKQTFLNKLYWASEECPIGKWKKV